MRDERRKEERSKQGQTNNKAKQHSTPRVVTVYNTWRRNFKVLNLRDV